MAGGISDFSILNQTRREDPEQNAGWAQVGGAAAGGLNGPGTAGGQQAFAKGELMGSQTVDALSKAKLNVMDAQARESAATFFEQHGQDLGFSPHEIVPIAMGARQGQLPPEQLFSLIKTKQENNARDKLNDPNATPQEREMALSVLAPGENSPKWNPQGTATFQPTQAGGGTPGAPQPPTTPNTPLPGVQVSPQGVAANAALTGERNAQAGAANARANAQQQKDAAGLPLKTGFMWKTDENGDIAYDANGHGIQTENPAAGTSAVGRRYVNTVVSSAASIAREADNIKNLGYDTSTGAQQIGGTHTGIFNTLTSNLGKTLSTTDQQEYQTTISNLTRMAANIEQNGSGRVNQAFIDKLSSLENRPGNTENSRLYNLAQIRQLLEAQHDAITANADAPPRAVHAYEQALDSVRHSIPWTASDVINFQRSGGDQTFQQFLAKHGSDNENAAPLPPVGGRSAPAAAPPIPSGWSVTVR